MSADSEKLHSTKQVLETPLADLGPNFFWTRTSAVPLTTEELAAASSGYATPAIEASLRIKVEMSRNALIAAPVPGVQSWMSHKRMLS